jgi:hypothetical protein
MLLLLCFDWPVVPTDIDFISPCDIGIDQAIKHTEAQCLQQKGAML